LGKLRLLSYLSVAKDEYIKRSDVGGFLFLSCDLFNFMGVEMTPENLKPKFGNVQMNPLSPNQILRNLENGYFMTHQEQAEAAQYIRQLQQSNEVLKEAVFREREACAQLCDDEGRVAPITQNEILNKQCYRLADLIRARGEK